MKPRFKRRLTNEIVDKRLLELGNKIIRLDNYIKARTKIRWQCKNMIEDITCNYIWKAAPDNIFSGGGCKKCNTYLKLTNEEVDKRLEFTEITRLDEVINCKNLMNWKCEKIDCGHIWKANLEHILHSKTGCPKHNMSKGEREIERCLKKLNLIFKTQVSFDDCKNLKTNRKFKFDFVIYDVFGNILLIIEFNGQQHYYFATKLGKKIFSEKEAKERFDDLQRKDIVKNKYCEDKNYKILTIKFTDFKNIEEILLKNLN
jgi:hypothetical protein